MAMSVHATSFQREPLTPPGPSALPPPLLQVLPGGAGEHTSAARIGVMALYHEHYRDTARLAFLLSGSRDHADDLAHDAFVKLYEHWDQVADPAKRVAYLRASVVNLTNSWHRRRGVISRHQAASRTWLGEASPASVEEAALASAQRRQVVEALRALPAQQRACVVLRHWLRMTEGEIADALGCSIGSVRTHLSRGHATLSTRLGGLR